MARKINLNSPEIFTKLGTPSMTPRTTTAMYVISTNRNRSSSLDNNPPSPIIECKPSAPEGRYQSIPSRTSRAWPVQASPIVHSKVARISGPNLSKTTDRSIQGIYSSIQHTHNYSPNYKAVWKGTGKKLLRFEATLARREFFKAPEFLVESKNVNYSQLDPNKAVPNLQKTTSRSTDEQVPAFMVNLHYLDRVSGHTMPNYKSLKMNNYMTTNFLPLTSSFDFSCKGKTSKCLSPVV